MLLGSEAPAGDVRVAPGQTLALPLVWQALTTPQVELVRFLHVLGPDGKPLLQQDAAPCAGACPAPSWLPNEILMDDIRLEVPDDFPPGSYPLAVGWYDAATVQRLPAYDTDGQRLADDLLRLPFRVVIEP